MGQRHYCEATVLKICCPRESPGGLVKSSPTPRVSASEGLGGSWQAALSLSFQVMLLLLVWEPRFADHPQCFWSELHDTRRRHTNTNTWTWHEKFKYHKGTPCSTAVVIRKTWMRHHCILIRMDKIKANRRYPSTYDHHALLMEMQNGEPYWKTVCQFLTRSTCPYHVSQQSQAWIFIQEKLKLTFT